MSTAAELDTYLTVRQACERFALSRSGFYELVRLAPAGFEATIVRVPPAARIRVKARAFAAWLEAQPK